MNELQIFSNPSFGSIRTLDEDGKVLFAATDVAKALGYSNPHDAISKHCKGVAKREALTNGGVQELNFIPEGDVYRLITHSNLPDAEKFERWLEQRWDARQPERLEHIRLKRQLRGKKEECGSEEEHGNCRVLPDHAGQ